MAKVKLNGYRTYGDWIMNSNEAAVFRAAFEVNDAMPLQLKGKTHELIFRASEQAWADYKSMRDENADADAQHLEYLSTLSA